ncbi:hypothetical protein VNO78_11770 [Psophocarpus tetragonolobus]|uniref:Uncharacterized protein n=1 Tax=Psophocarpus tetragonolobus TaxID=3891 RepID=A0AAN9SPP2_PSOTE
MLCTTTLRLPNKTLFTAHAVFFVLMASSVYSFYLDKTQANTKNKEGDKVLNMVSCGAFSFMSLSLSKLTGLGFEAAVFHFFLGAFMVSVMKWNLKFALAAAIFCYILNKHSHLLRFPRPQCSTSDFRDGVKDTNDKDKNFTLDEDKSKATEDQQLYTEPHFNDRVGDKVKILIEVEKTLKMLMSLFHTQQQQHKDLDSHKRIYVWMESLKKSLISTRRLLEIQHEYEDPEQPRDKFKVRLKSEN